jgi:hypothetical protein
VAYFKRVSQDSPEGTENVYGNSSQENIRSYCGSNWLLHEYSSVVVLFELICSVKSLLLKVRQTNTMWERSYQSIPLSVHMSYFQNHLTLTDIDEILH